MSPILASREFVQYGIVFHCVVISLCVLSTRLYSFLNSGRPQFLRWWGYALLFVLAIYLLQLALLDYGQNYWRIGAEGALSNLSNVCLARMALEIHGGEGRKLSSSAVLCTLLPLLLAAMAIATGNAWPSSPLGGRIDRDEINWWIVAIHASSAILSAISLSGIAHALYLRMTAPRRVAMLSFKGYAVFQVLYIATPLFVLLGKENAMIIEELYRNTGFLFKASCTVVLLFAASELGKRWEKDRYTNSIAGKLGLLFPRRDDATPLETASKIRMVGPRRLLVASADEHVANRIQRLIDDLGYSSVTVSKKTANNPLLRGLSECHCAILIRTSADDVWSDLVSANLASQRKEWITLQVLPSGAFVVVDDHTGTRELNGKDVRAYASEWFNRRGLMPEVAFRTSQLQALA